MRSHTTMMDPSVLCDAWHGMAWHGWYHVAHSHSFRVSRCITNTLRTFENTLDKLRLASLLLPSF